MSNEAPAFLTHGIGSPMENCITASGNAGGGFDRNVVEPGCIANDYIHTIPFVVESTNCRRLVLVSAVDYAGIRRSVTPRYRIVALFAG